MTTLEKNTKSLLNWLAVKDKPEKADLIFLFGGLFNIAPQKGLELYNQGYAPKILVTGKKGATWKEEKTIAETFKDYLIKGGVPDNNILVQDTSTNTLEDITHARPILEQAGLKFKKVILVSRPFHQRRVQATFKKQFPYAVKIVNQPGNEPFEEFVNRYGMEKAAEKLLGEFDKLKLYADKGDIENQAVPENIAEVVKAIREVLAQSEVGQG